jgi:chromosome segregation ATPase
MSDEQVVFQQHPEFAAGRAELQELEAVLEQLPRLIEEAQHEASEAARQAAQAAVAAARSGAGPKEADRHLQAASLARGRLEVLRQQEAQLRARQAELRRELEHQSGTLWQQNRSFVAQQAEPLRREVLRRFAALRPQLEELLRAAESIEAAVAQAGGRPDHAWAWRIKQTLDHAREVQELLGGGGAA